MIAATRPSMRNVPVGEDGCDLRHRPVAHLMPILNNIATGLIALAGFKNATMPAASSMPCLILPSMGLSLPDVRLCNSSENKEEPFDKYRD